MKSCQINFFAAALTNPVSLFLHFQKQFLKVFPVFQYVLKDVPQALSINLLEVAEQRLYQAVFHGVKALLYRDGIKEKSHICVSLYFKENYKNNFYSYKKVDGNTLYNTLNSQIITDFLKWAKMDLGKYPSFLIKIWMISKKHAMIFILRKQ